MVSHTCCGQNVWQKAGFMCSASGAEGVWCNTGGSGTTHRQQHGPHTQQTGSGQDLFLLLFAPSVGPQGRCATSCLLQLNIPAHDPPDVRGGAVAISKTIEKSMESSLSMRYLRIQMKTESPELTHTCSLFNKNLFLSLPSRETTALQHKTFI